MKEVVEYRICGKLLKFERQGDGSLLPSDLWQQPSVLIADTARVFIGGLLEVAWKENVDVEGGDDRDAEQRPWVLTRLV